MLKAQDWQNSILLNISMHIPPFIPGIETSESYDICFIAPDAEDLPIAPYVSLSWSTRNIAQPPTRYPDSFSRERNPRRLS